MSKAALALICGMHRSGTSLVAKAFELFGFELGESLMAPGKDNPKGFFEDVDVVDLNERLLQQMSGDWDLPPQAVGSEIIWSSEDLQAGVELLKYKFQNHKRLAIKDPRICLLMAYWQAVVHEVDCELYVCIVYRNPLDIEASLKDRNQFPMEVAHRLTEYYWNTFLSNAPPQSVVIAYDEIVKNPDASLAKLGDWLGIPTIQAKRSSYLNTFIDTRLRHHAHTLEDLRFSEGVSPQLISLSEFLEGRAESTNDISIASFSPVDLSPELSRRFTALQASRYRQQISSTQKILSAMGFDSAGLREQLIHRQEYVASLETDLQTSISQRHQLEDANRQLADANQRLAKDLDEEIRQKITLIGELDKLHGVTDELSALRQHFKHLDDIHKSLLNSVSLRLGRLITYPIRKPITKLLLPKIQENAGSIQLFEFVRASLAHPLRALKLFSPKRARNFYRLATSDRHLIEQVVGKYDIAIGDQSRSKALAPPNAIPDDISSELSFVTPIDPMVSILIPVYNELPYTIECLRSIARHPPQCSFEIVIADDCSTDETQAVLAKINGIQVVRNSENIRFLRSCNAAVEHCKGEYLFLLNNDTVITEGCIDSLVATFRTHPDAGVVGSKLLFPDGRLQEAGGIIWQDASAWNFGRLQDPSEPAFNYTKKCDYVSGAALMIPRQLFCTVGKFDERYAPSYYEDTDLCFTIRSKGLEVYLQPRSEVIHFEGVSNGTDEASGLKQYQAQNQTKFFDKWRVELENFHYPNGTQVFSARDRSRHQTTILVIDHYVPHFDKDAGSQSTYHYLQLFVELGYHVIFMGDNFYPHQPYTAALQALGIEVLYGEKMQKGFKDWLRREAPAIDIAYIMRPHIALEYIDFINTLPAPPKRIYFGHDLHFLRIQREYELNKDPKTKSDAATWRAKELALFEKFDAVFYPSAVEVAEVKSLAPTTSVHEIPLNIYAPDNEAVYDPTERQGLLFVGGFNHPPNADGLIWFCENVMPQLTSEHSLLTLHIVGSNMPEQVHQLNSHHICVHGYLSDEALNQLYSKVRASVVPLRFGAGVKGKVLEAMARGVPVFTTSIGAEGIPENNDVLFISDNEQEMLQDLVASYDDFSRLKFHSRKGLNTIAQHFSKSVATAFVKKHFPIKSPAHKE